MVAIRVPKGAHHDPVPVTLSSGGLPLGKTRIRRVNVVGPHLHRELMCAVPFSAKMSQVKWLRHIKSVISIVRDLGSFWIRFGNFEEPISILSTAVGPLSDEGLDEDSCEHRPAEERQ